MNNFIKQAASRMNKPTKQLIKTETIILKECTISFNFDNFYYCNENIFDKQYNTLEDVLKSWAIIECFKYEKYVITGLVKIIKKYSHITDLFFLPVGWMTGIESGKVTSEYHVIIKTIFTGSILHIRNKIKEFLSYHSIKDLVIIQTDKELTINCFDTPEILPTAVISFFPFDTESVLIVLFFGTYNDSYCGISYVLSDNIYTIVDLLKPFVNEINILTDDITRLTSVRLFDSLSSSKKFPEKKIFSICEFISIFDKTKFSDGGVSSLPQKSMNLIPYIPKKIVSLIELPSYVDIKCITKNGIDFITHIDNKRLSMILIIAKDDFIKNVTFSGTFKKENLIWKGYYTYRILEATFTFPKLNVSTKGKRYLKKNIYDNSTFTTRTGLYIL
ncbi:hypothetical protein [White-tailed deer poxvirus]|nr:hypothetical protein [White-tailed deer poxvirus]